MKHVRPASSKEHWKEKRSGCPCLEEVYLGSSTSIRRSVRYKCHATNNACEFDDCPFYYWVFYVKK